MSIDGRGPSLSRSADNTISALKSKNGRLEERAKSLEGERNRARDWAVQLEQRLAAVKRQLELHIESRQDTYKRHPSDINSMAVTAAEDALSWAEDGDRPAYQDDLAEEVAF